MSSGLRFCFICLLVALAVDGRLLGAVSENTDVANVDPRDHWAFQPLVRPAIPKVEHRSSSSGNPIDAFFDSKHFELGLKVQPSASREMLLRRAMLDLIGLPPTHDELLGFR